MSPLWGSSNFTSPNFQPMDVLSFSMGCHKFWTTSVAWGWLQHTIRYASIIWLLFLITYILIGVWLREGQNIKHLQDTCLKEVGIHHSILLTTPHSMVNTIGRTYVSSWRVNKLALLKTGSEFCRCFIGDFLMLHKLCRVNMIGSS